MASLRPSMDFGWPACNKSLGVCVTASGRLQFLIDGLPVYECVSVEGCQRCLLNVTLTALQLAESRGGEQQYITITLVFGGESRRFLNPDCFIGIKSTP
jgi:hypothetical protein